MKIVGRREFVAASSFGVLSMLRSRFSLAQSDEDARPSRPADVRIIRRRVASIDWYCEVRGQGPTIVLIPSGEGDCGVFDTVAAALSSRFTVLTFDMPGFSRSSSPPNFSNYSMTQAASEIAALVQALEVGPGTFYGSSSGGHVALCLAADHPQLVRSVAVHEVPLSHGVALLGLPSLTDDQIAQACRAIFRNDMNADPRRGTLWAKPTIRGWSATT